MALQPARQDRERDRIAKDRMNGKGCVDMDGLH